MSETMISQQNNNIINGHGHVSDSVPNSVDSCPICFEDMLTKNISTTSCGHKFCLSCITKHICNGDNRCPMCRFELIDKSDIKKDNSYNDIQEQILQQQIQHENTMLYRIIEASLRYTIVQGYRDIFPQHVYDEIMKVCNILDYHNTIYYGTNFREYSIQTTNRGSVQVRHNLNSSGLIISSINRPPTTPPNDNNSSQNTTQTQTRVHRNRTRTRSRRTNRRHNTSATTTTQRRCGICREIGHDRRRCPNNP